MDVSLFSLLAFSLVYFVGLVSQPSDIPLSSKSQITNSFHNLRREDIPIENKQKNIPIEAECKFAWLFRELERKYDLEKCLHAEFTDPRVLFDFILLCQEIKYLFLLEFFFIFICITATYSHTGQQRATREGGRNI